MSSRLPRLEMSDFPPALAAALHPRVKRLGYLGEFFKCSAHQPVALTAFIEFTESCKGGLPTRLVEVVALTCAGWMSNAYERNQHERLSVRLGFGRDWVASVNALNPDEPSLMTDQERRIQRLALRVLDTRGKGSADLFDQAVAELGPDKAVAILLVIGRYVVHGLFVNTLELKPPVPSVFDDGFEG